MRSKKTETQMPIEEGNNWTPCSPAERPALMHFFKTILPCILEDKKLRLPVKFVRKFGVELSNVAQVIVPSGHTWKLGLSKGQENIWFDEGWHDFVEHHLIGSGFLLVFAYRGFSEFDVNIFDASACEIQYPCTEPTKSKSKETNRGSKTGVVDVNASKEKSNDSADQNLGTKEFGRCVSAAMQEKQSRKPDSNKTSEAEESVKEKSPEIIDLVDDTESRKEKLNKEKDKMARAAQMFKPKNPSFMITLQPYHIHKQYLAIPHGFSKRQMLGVPPDIKLEVSNGRDWPIRVTGERGQRLGLSKGWNKFVEENGMVAGDVCGFECVKEDCSVLKVSVFR